MSLSIVEQTQALARELGRSPTQLELRLRGIWVYGRQGYTTVSALLRDAGLQPRRPGEPLAPLPSLEEVLEQVRALAQRLGRAPTCLELRDHRLWMPRRLGIPTIGELLQRAGVERNAPRTRPKVSRPAPRPEPKREPRILQFRPSARRIREREDDSLWGEPRWMA